MPLTEVQAPNTRSVPRHKLALPTVLALTLLTFASTFTFGWVYDDPPQIPGNSNLRWDRLGFLFTHQLWASAADITTARFYRPLLSLWFLLNKTFFGLHPQWFHVTTVLAHLLATALAFFIARKLLNDATAALFAAAIFGVHPLQVESVSWISAVNDPLAAVFCFGSFLAYRKAREVLHNSRFWRITAGVLFICALLTKEVSVVLPAIVLVDFWVTAKDNPTQQSTRNRFAGMIVVIAGVIEILWLLLRHRVLAQAATTASQTWPSALFTAPKILLFQLWHVIFPVGLSPHYNLRALNTVALAQSLLLYCTVVVLAGVAVFIIQKSCRLAVAFAWLILPLVPSLNLRWLNEDDFVHDRYMYMSMLGAALLAGAAFSVLTRRWPTRRLIPGLGFALIIALAFGSAIQSQFWANNLALFCRGVAIAPHNEWAQLDYGASLAQRDRFAEAADHFVLSYNLKPGWRAAADAAFAYRVSNQPTPAERWYNQALRLNPSNPDAWFGIGQIRIAQNQPAAALLFFRKALELNPSGVGFHAAVGHALDRLGQHDAAVKQYQAELQLHPTQPDALAGLRASPPSQP